MDPKPSSHDSHHDPKHDSDKRNKNLMLQRHPKKRVVSSKSTANDNRDSVPSPTADNRGIHTAPASSVSQDNTTLTAPAANNSATLTLQQQMQPLLHAHHHHHHQQQQQQHHHHQQQQHQQQQQHHHKDIGLEMAMQSPPKSVAETLFSPPITTSTLPTSSSSSLSSVGAAAAAAAAAAASSSSAPTRHLGLSEATLAFAQTTGDTSHLANFITSPLSTSTPLPPWSLMDHPGVQAQDILKHKIAGSTMEAMEQLRASHATASRKRSRGDSSPGEAEGIIAVHKRRHNAIEQRRRDKINVRIMDIKTMLPPMYNSTTDKASKAQVLTDVIVYIQDVQARLRLLGVRDLVPDMMQPVPQAPVSFSLNPHCHL
eukprot:c12116_g2_i1.p1 GENE.c12116_g2_i1~~c12116_g2_i1.p1  ORF type:complete len:371 (+),score=116.68 c12116_g2_i1:217-1329(+)